jgi:hypothetical protein
VKVGKTEVEKMRRWETKEVGCRNLEDGIFSIVNKLS